MSTHRILELADELAPDRIGHPALSEDIAIELLIRSYHAWQAGGHSREASELYELVGLLAGWPTVETLERLSDAAIVERWESGQSLPSCESLAVLTHLLDLSPEPLLRA